MVMSVVVPAHNEELLLPAGLQAIMQAARQTPDDVEVVVVANRCTDATADVAVAGGARVVHIDARNLSAVRNAGVAAATGDVVVTVDADCRMSVNALAEVGRRLQTGRFVGGGTKVIPERTSPGIVATYAVMEVVTRLSGVGGGMFWLARADFDAIGGFDERLLVGEDLDFARRLRARGRLTGRRFTVIREASITASCRKFDRFGDWHMFAMVGQIKQIRASMKGVDTRWVDHYFYDFNSPHSAPTQPGSPPRSVSRPVSGAETTLDAGSGRVGDVRDSKLPVRRGPARAGLMGGGLPGQ